MHSNSTTMNYLKSSGLLPSLQSDFRPGNSTETAVLRVLSVLLQALDSGDAAALVLLDLSVAFDIVDYAILCRWLRLSFGLDGSRSGVVPVIRSWAFTVRSAWCPQFVFCQTRLWSPTRLIPGSYTVYYYLFITP